MGPRDLSRETFTFLHVINETLNNVSKWKDHAVIQPRVFDRIYILSPRLSSRVSRDFTHAEQVSCILLSKIQYTVLPQTQILPSNMSQHYAGDTHA